jgi:hypothetical protein
MKTERQEFADKYIIQKIRVVEGDNSSGRRILITASHSPDYPFQISLLTSGGRLLGEYWNAGHLSRDAYVCEDIDGDGLKEIIMGGQNNAYNKACLVVLASDRVEGTSPQDDAPGFRFIGLPKGKEKSYILFPQSVLCRLYQVRNLVSNIYLDKADKKIEVVIVEYQEYTADLNRYSLRYILDYNLNVLEVKAEDYFLSKIKQLKTMKILDHFEDSDIADYKNQVQYWDGAVWTKTPAVNEYWQRHN